jgi:DNA-directed RNA polymerase subunit beta'
VTGRDITQGLPRVEEIFERRTPKVPAVIAHNDGMISDVKKVDGKFVITLLASPSSNVDSASQSIDYIVDVRRVPTVKKGQDVVVGQPLTDGSIDTLELFRVAGKKVAEAYIVNEVAKVYELHGTPVDRKHLELIIRQMFSRRKVTKPGDSLLSTGEVVEHAIVTEENARLEKEGKMPASADTMLMGITEVALSTTSWLSSASFQHTNRVLITAAIQGRVDALRGLKENVIIGGLIPAGTGFDPAFVDMTGVRAPASAEHNSVVE